ncbi:NPC intracellular cholesterol transporter 2 homolog a-like [Octopus sinensis]|uniref:NPC intracellular cholesterol transporter 2 homolog a-like n=1 Tax=Octopus sinensis TaxID=2607531 RepID=A0A7E6F6X3_9MOLL|nr:NPC intracellular cholesterol transporter 2 homolog a-like [Octopus sinensis]
MTGFDLFYQKGPADLGTPTDVRISDCTKSPCILKKNTNVSIEVDFTATADVQTVKDAVYGIIAGIHVPFPTSQPDACKDKGLTCPLKKGQKYTYKSVIPISSTYPDIQLVVEYTIKNEDKKPVFCIDIPAMIQ